MYNSRLKVKDTEISFKLYITFRLTKRHPGQRCLANKDRGISHILRIHVTSLAFVKNLTLVPVFSNKNPKIFQFTKKKAESKKCSLFFSDSI